MMALILQPIKYELIDRPALQYKKDMAPFRLIDYKLKYNWNEFD